jgi:predicted RNA-binding protein with PUA-like domain
LQDILPDTTSYNEESRRMNYWLLKSEPDTFSIDDLRRRPGRKEAWDGVRNYQARNFIRDSMREGDGVFFYHSSCAVPGIVGIARVASVARPDPSQFNPESPYFDPGSSPESPRWFLVDVQYERHLQHSITLQQLKTHADQLAGLALLNRSRLSVMPVARAHWEYILTLEGLQSD